MLKFSFEYFCQITLQQQHMWHKNGRTYERMHPVHDGFSVSLASRVPLAYVLFV